MKLEAARWRMPLCPYLMTGNHRMLIHLDAYGVPQSLQWPAPGAPDRLGWRNPCDEWPYWEEMSQEDIRARMPYFEYPDGHREYLHEAVEVEMDYLPDTNVLEGRCLLPGGAEIRQFLFTPPGRDVWVRRFELRGAGRFVFRGDFFAQAVRSNSISGDCRGGAFRGFLDAAPRGVFAIASDAELRSGSGQVFIESPDSLCATVYLCMAEDMKRVSEICREALDAGFEKLLAETVECDRRWIANARPPRSRHPFLRKNCKRWLLSNYLLVLENGGTISGVRPFWSFAWPRDCAQQALGFAAAGFQDEAARILEWNFANAPESGVYEARYRSDSSPVTQDNRPRQGDSAGFLCFAAAWLLKHGYDPAWAGKISEKVFFLADRMLEHINPVTGLPSAEADHRETRIAESLSIAVATVAGLRGAAFLDSITGGRHGGKQWLGAAAGIAASIEKELYDPVEKYFIASRTPLDRRADIALCWGAGPFAVWEDGDEKVRNGIKRIYSEKWNREAGGVIAAAGTPYASYWMYYASLLLLGAAGTGLHAIEREVLDSLEKNVPPQGLIPEQTSLSGGILWGCAPLPPPQANLIFYAMMYPGE